jgi:hypothetical protein
MLTLHPLGGIRVMEWAQAAQGTPLWETVLKVLGAALPVIGAGLRADSGSQETIHESG